MLHRYLIALGSNVPHHAYGQPRQILAAAALMIGGGDAALERMSPIVKTAPLGPSRRRFANAAAIAQAALNPQEMLEHLQAIEAHFGRKAGGRRWAARVLDLDIVLWSGGIWCADGLAIPHVAFRTREFVLQPAAAIAPGWRDPVSGLTLRQLHARLTRARPTLRWAAGGEGP